jgi:multidrug efflux pump subunit AcrA (membrane-fusion protein)
MRKGKRFYTGIVISSLALLSCGQTDPPATAQDSPEARTPVTVTSVSIQGLEEAVELNATSSFLQKSFVKATANGYVKANPCSP